MGGQEAAAQDRLIKIRNGIVDGKVNPTDKSNLKYYVNALLVMADVKPSPEQLPIFMHRLMTHGHSVVDAPRDRGKLSKMSYALVFDPRDPEVVKEMWRQIMETKLIEKKTWDAARVALEDFFGLANEFLQ